MGLQLINEWNMERMIEELENQCYIKTNALKKTEEGLGIEYDEDVACDVCRMLESEDTNEMVFCDGCDICVHQACYGIQTIPEGSWLCRICALGIKPMCLLCPKRGGAMKSTKSGTKWTHVSCALWIPEVSIGCPEKMEPVTKISNIPPSRWALVCSLCKERVGACIQCSVKQCKTAFHVTCGFAHNLDMKTIVDDSDEADGIHLRAYCPKHTKNRNASDSESPKKEDNVDNENEISEAEMAKKRLEKLKQIESEFFTLVDVNEIAEKFYIPEEAVDIVAEYWKLKRKVNNNKPLITPKMEEEDQMQKQQKDSLSARMKMFVHLRQDLERARNLCYMISKREKTKKQFFQIKESVFKSQVRVLTDPDLNLSAREAEKVRQEYHFNSLYSNYGILGAHSSKQPRNNLFTLENLKTPKDFSDNEKTQDSYVNETKSSSGQSNLGKEDRQSSKSKAAKGSKTDKASHRKNLFAVDTFNIMTDSPAESSGDEHLSTAAKTTHSSQMSRLGKVKLKEIEEVSATGDPIVKTVPESPSKKSLVPASDFGKKLSLFLQSKTKMQQLQERRYDQVREALHIVVDQSEDSEVFTSDTNTVLSTVDQPRNLFEQFSMQDKKFVSSPEISGDNKCNVQPLRHQKKLKKRKHSRSPPKVQKLRLLVSPSEQSSSSSVSVKSELTPDVTADVGALTTVNSQLSATALPSDTDSQPHPPVLSPKGRKKKSRKNRSLTPDRALKSKNLLLSPTPRVEPDSVYATLDGDIYVPTGKILMTERTIVLDDPKEEDGARLQSKLRLKKKANSPLKGKVTYEVVKDEDDRKDIFVDDPPKLEAEAEKNIFDRVVETLPLVPDVAEVSTQRSVRLKNKNVEEASPGRRTRHSKTETAGQTRHSKTETAGQTRHSKTETAGQTQHSKTESASQTQNSKVPEVASVPEVKAEVVSEDQEPSETNSRKKRQPRRKRNVSTNDTEKGELSDENFRPSGGSPKVPPIDKSQRPKRSRKNRLVHSDETDGEDDSDDFQEKPHKRNLFTKPKAPPNGAQSVQLIPLPNKPALNCLLDAKKLVVKEELCKQVGNRLSRHLKERGRWGSFNGVSNQTTLDKFLKRTGSSENVFSKPDSKVNGKVTRPDLCPLRVNKSSSLNSYNDSSGLPDADMAPASPVKSAVFGCHSSPRQGLNSYRSPHKNDVLGDQNLTPSNDSKESVFGDVEKLHKPSRQLSFEDVGKKNDISPAKSKCDLAEVVKTPSKCELSEFSEEKLDCNRSYRSHSPPSSEGSCASSRIHQLDSRESTPSRRVTRSWINEDDQSPNTRLRKRETLLKAPQFKL
ncbi:PHD finger protein rhinoceros-like isoform X2 [Physella acuta]|nr:PHD finger protein rhinoceros-like isoform X2 [Physella acuta]